MTYAILVNKGSVFKMLDATPLLILIYIYVTMEIWPLGCKMTA